MLDKVCIQFVNSCKFFIYFVKSNFAEMSFLDTCYKTCLSGMECGVGYMALLYAVELFLSCFSFRVLFSSCFFSFLAFGTCIHVVSNESWWYYCLSRVLCLKFDGKCTVHALIFSTIMGEWGGGGIIWIWPTITTSFSRVIKILHTFLYEI